MDAVMCSHPQRCGPAGVPVPGKVQDGHGRAGMMLHCALFVGHVSQTHPCTMSIAFQFPHTVPVIARRISSVDGDAGEVYITRPLVPSPM